MTPPHNSLFRIAYSFHTSSKSKRRKVIPETGLGGSHIG
jgi:hypothetical protein